MIERGKQLSRWLSETLWDRITIKCPFRYLDVVKIVFKIVARKEKVK